MIETRGRNRRCWRIVIPLILTTGLVAGPPEVGPQETVLLKHAKDLGSSRQVLLVSREKNRPVLRAFEKTDSGWTARLGPFPVSIGYAGFARPGAKREGDGKTPVGIYRLGTAFGYAPAIASSMPYRQASNDDFWVDDVESPRYNTWVHGPPNARSFERMRRPDNLYSLGIVIEYNTSPVVAGLGSAIFLHVTPEPTAVTAGCVAVSHEQLVQLLAWLKPEAEPGIAILPE